VSRPPSLPSTQCVRSALSSVAKRPEPKADHSLQSISKIKNAGSYTSSPSFLQGALGKHWDVFNSAVIYICQVEHINVGCFSWGQSHCVGSLPVSPRSHATCRSPPSSYVFTDSVHNITCVYRRWVPYMMHKTVRMVLSSHPAIPLPVSGTFAETPINDK